MTSYSLSSGTLDWLESLQAAVKAGEKSVLVTVLAIKGSAPREPGVKMLVQSAKCVGTIGGGHLEAEIIRKAREMLELDSQGYQRLKIPLGASLGQCCGGHVELVLEVVNAKSADWVDNLKQLVKDESPCILVTSLKNRGINAEDNKFDNTGWPAKTVLTKRTLNQNESSTVNHTFDYDHEYVQSLFNQVHFNDPIIKDNVLYESVNSKLFRLYLFGAGHVGKAVVQSLHSLPCEIIWIENRAEMLTDFPCYQNVHLIVTDDPIAIVPTISAGEFVVVMTHNHQLDFAITEQVLTQTSASYVGLIGSNTKSQRFKQRLNAKGLSADMVRNLICPIGIDGISGKHPTQIALSLSAQLLQYADDANLESRSSSTQAYVQNAR